MYTDAFIQNDVNFYRSHVSSAREYPSNDKLHKNKLHTFRKRKTKHGMNKNTNKNNNGNKRNDKKEGDEGDGVRGGKGAKRRQGETKKWNKMRTMFEQ